MKLNSLLFYYYYSIVKKNKLSLQRFVFYYEKGMLTYLCFGFYKEIIK